jgi:hypothetical protein
MALAAIALVALGASDSQAHYHKGKLARYDIGPPSLLLSASDESRLRSGRSVQQALPGDDGVSQRLIMVQDIKAPCNIVLGCACVCVFIERMRLCANAEKKASVGR